MARCVYNSQFVAAECYFIAVNEGVADRWVFKIRFAAYELHRLFCKSFHERDVRFVDLSFQAISVKYSVVAEIMIHMAMSGKEMPWGKAVAADITDNS